MLTLPWVDAETVAGLLPMPDAVDAIERALRAGLDPAADPPRTAVGTTCGQLLLMPSEAADRVGVKVVSVAPDNHTHGLPRVQAVYVLMDATTLTPLCLLDGTALTSLRTPAVSAVAIRHLAIPDASRLVLFGTGPQAWWHVSAVRAVRPIRDVVVVGLDQQSGEAFAERVRAETGLPASVGTPAAVAQADVVVCATTATRPLFDGVAVPDTACVVAIGSHEPHARELDARLLGRARAVVVEDRATALREAGDVVLGIADGAIGPPDLVPLAELVTGRASTTGAGPAVFKSVGMSWQDLVVAGEIARRAAAPVS